MENAFDFLGNHKEVALATVERDKPKIRVFKLDYYDLTLTPPTFEHYEYREQN